jgi:short-subunit dehydrogenase
VIVNAGVSEGAAVGTGQFDANKQTFATNLISALAQAEAALEIFRDQGHGHLVLISSTAAVRAMPGRLTAYSASKAGLSALGSGIHADLIGTPIKITTLHPGYIESEMTTKKPGGPYVTPAAAGAKALYKAVESEVVKAYVPFLPWGPMSLLLRLVPAGKLKKLM